jgi:hypothetical protein
MAGKKQDIKDLTRRLRDAIGLVGSMTQKELFQQMAPAGYGRRIVTRALTFMVDNKNGGLFIDGKRVPVSVKKYPKFDLYLLKNPKRPKDTNSLASVVVGLATGENSEEPTNDGKNPAAVALGRLGGLKGGKARAKALNKKERLRIAKKAAKTRWSKKQ